MRKFLLIISVFVIVLVGCSEKQKANKPVQTQNTETKTEISNTAKEFPLDGKKAEELLVKGKKLYADGQYEEALDSFIEVFVSGNKDQIIEANKYVDFIHSSKGKVIPSQKLPNDFDEKTETNENNQTQNRGYKEKLNSKLVQAIYMQDVEKVKKLLENGADVNYDGAGHEGSPLAVACRDGNKEIVEILLDAGADVNQEADFYLYPFPRPESPLIIASEKGHTDIVKILINAGARKESFCELVKSGDLKGVQIFIKAGRDVNNSKCEVNPCGGVNDVDEDSEEYCDSESAYDPLIRVAAEQGHIEIVKELIKAGADVNATCETYTSCNDTPLTIFSQNGNLDMVKALLKAGANVDLDKALYGASKLGHTKIVEELIKAGADVNYMSKENDMFYPTSLSIAIEKGHKEIISLLKKHGAKE